MLRRRALITVVLPLAAALLAALVFLRLANPRRAAVHPVAVAAVPLPAGHVLAPSDLKIVDVAGALPGEVPSVTPLLGEMLQVPVSAGEPIQTNDAVPLSAAPLDRGLPNGERAVDIALSPVSAVNYTIHGGDRVDVVAFFNTGSGVPGAPISDVVLSDIPVLAVIPPAGSTGSAVSGGSTGTGLVTLEVTPAESATLDLAAQLGTVTLALRPLSDKSQIAPFTKAGSLP